jgi:hypothetical protein
MPIESEHLGRAGLADIENLEAGSDVNKVTKGAERRWGND